MNKLVEIVLVAGLVAAAVATIEPALAQKAPAVRKQPPILYRSTDDLRCVERSFSIISGTCARIQ